MAAFDRLARRKRTLVLVDVLLAMASAYLCLLFLARRRSGGALRGHGYGITVLYIGPDGQRRRDAAL